MKITCNLYSQWVALIRQELDNIGFKHSMLSDQNCILTWFKWKRRSVPKKRRNVQKASGFICPNHLQQGLLDLENAFMNGHEIWPWQSKMIDQPLAEDGLYADYGVIHFHLGVGFEANNSGYIVRTYELLFAIVDSDSIYEIGIYNHGDWYEKDILEIIDSNWPDLLDRVTLHGIVKIGNILTDRQDIKALRDGHVMVVMQLNGGRIIAPLGGGMATDGTPLEAVKAADYFTKIIRNGEEQIKKQINDRITAGTMESKDYEVSLYMTDNEISGQIGNSYKWTFWNRS